MKLKTAITASLMYAMALSSGCILVSDIAEGFNPVPYGGMYTTSYFVETMEENGEEVAVKYMERFPIGFFGDLNVKFWNAYGDYKNTCTWRRFQEWRKLPESERAVPCWKGRKVGGNWVEIESWKDGKGN